MACKCETDCKGNCSKFTLDQLLTRLMSQACKPVLLIAKTDELKAELWPIFIAEAAKAGTRHGLVNGITINYWQNSIAVNGQVAIIMTTLLEYIERPNVDEFDILTYGIPSKAFLPFANSGYLGELNYKPQLFYNIPAVAPEQEANTLAVIYVPGYSEAMYLNIANLDKLLGEGVAEAGRDILVQLFNLAPVEAEAKTQSVDVKVNNPTVKFQNSTDVFADFAKAFQNLEDLDFSNFSFK